MIAPIGAAAAPLAAAPVGAAPPPAGGFADAVKRGIDSVSAAELQADSLIQAAASGQDVPVHELMTSTAKAQLSVDLLTQVRDKAVEAYQEIMRMQV